ncbi:MAG TPA: MFS transporter [Candidatus Deferrimicrobium sp.]|nr:MFS transporter [Candidatus Deferrimicrobium sp.]
MTPTSPLSDAPPSSSGTANEVSVRKWLTYVTVEGACATVFIVLTGGAFLTGLALHLGASDFEIGLLAAIPFLAQVMQLLSAYLVDRTGHRKAITLWSSVVARQLWWLVLPLLFLAGGWRLAAFLTLVALSQAAIMVATPSWMSWMADLVPGKLRGRYFGYRSALLALVTVAVTIIGGIVLDEFRDIGKDNVGFAVIVGAGCLLALIAALLLSRTPDHSARRHKVEASWYRLSEPLRDASFRKLLRVFVVWNFALGLAAAFFSVHMLTNLRMSFTQVSLYISLHALTGILFNRPWGTVIDRFGSKPVVAFCAFGITFVPLIWWLPRPDFLWILAVEAVYSGTLWTGAILAAFNIPIANSPKKGRTAYLAMFSVIPGLAFFVASVIGGIVAENLSHFRWEIGRQTIVNYHLLFTLSSALRFVAALMALKYREPKEKSISQMTQYMGRSILRWLSTGRRSLPWP